MYSFAGRAFSPATLGEVLSDKRAQTFFHKFLESIYADENLVSPVSGSLFVFDIFVDAISDRCLCHVTIIRRFTI